MNAPEGEELPAAAWWLSWSFLAGQVVAAVTGGFQEQSAWFPSILLGVALVTLFAHGVLRGRMVRTVIVAILLSIGTLVELGVVLGGELSEFFGLAFTAFQLGCFVWFVRSPWFAWQRTRPEGGPSIAPLMMIAVAVGILGGLLGADTGGARFELDGNF